jgi:hypothetical protein
MRGLLALAAATIFFVTIAANAFAIMLSSKSGDLANSPVQLVEEKQNEKETLKQKVKRIWKEWTGYKFDVTCSVLPIPIPIIPSTHGTCTETGKDREDARAKCQSQHPFCAITDARRS